MNLKPYPEYKDSGVAWLGQVPEHWGVQRLKFLAHIKTGGRDTVDRKDDGGYPFFVRSQTVEHIDSFSFDGEAILTAGDGAGVAKVFHYFIGKFDYHQRVYKFSNFRHIRGKFFFYYFSCTLRYEAFRDTAKSTVDSLRLPMLQNFPVPLPFFSEQLTIARFLDYKTSQIARFIKAKKRMIELLKEQKLVIINDAVTGKIVIEDEGGRLKAEKRPDSSFIPHPSSFLQTLPEGWEVKRIKSISHIRYGLGQPPKEKEDGLPLIRATNVDHGKIVIKDLLRIDIKDVPASRDAVLREGEIIVVRSGAYTADSAIIPKEFTGSVAGYDMVMTVFKAMPEYVALALLSKYLRDDQLIQASMRAAQPHLNKEELGSSFIILPQNEEQETIVLVTEKKLNALDLAISRTEREIALIQEYRTRLISDVVTGKIDVRDIEIPDIADIDVTLDESIDEPEGEEELETAEAEE